MFLKNKDLIHDLLDSFKKLLKATGLTTYIIQSDLEVFAMLRKHLSL